MDVADTPSRSGATDDGLRLTSFPPTVRAAPTALRSIGRTTDGRSASPSLSARWATMAPAVDGTEGRGRADGPPRPRPLLRSSSSGSRAGAGRRRRPASSSPGAAPWDAMPAVLVGFEWQDGCPLGGGGVAPLHPTPADLKPIHAPRSLRAPTPVGARRTCAARSPSTPASPRRRATAAPWPRRWSTCRAPPSSWTAPRPCATPTPRARRCSRPGAAGRAPPPGGRRAPGGTDHSPAGGHVCLSCAPPRPLFPP